MTVLPFSLITLPIGSPLGTLGLTSSFSFLTPPARSLLFSASSLATLARRSSPSSSSPSGESEIATGLRFLRLTAGEPEPEAEPDADVARAGGGDGSARAAGDEGSGQPRCREQVSETDEATYAQLRPRARAARATGT